MPWLIRIAYERIRKAARILWEVKYPDMTDESVMKAFDEAYRSYGNMLYRICLSYLRTPHDAEDALQDVFIKYMSKTRSFDSEEHKKAWLIRVAANRCKDMLRRKKRDALFGHSDEIGEDAAERPEGGLGVLDKIFALPERYREVFVLHYLENLSVAEISDICKISQSAVKMRLMRGRQTLKDELWKDGVGL